MNERAINLWEILQFYLSKFNAGENSMTLEQLQADIKTLNTLLDAIANLTPTPVDNQIFAFLKSVDENPILQNIILLVINNIINNQTNVLVPQPEPCVCK